MVLKIQKKNLLILKDDDRTYVYLQSSHFQQNDVIVTNNNNVINIYIVYKLDTISSARNTCNDCNEDFAGIINCTNGYMWNPGTCECQCDMWCKPGQYLDHKNCVCKNKLIGRVIAECTTVINETMINNKDNITNDNTTTYIFNGLFSVLLFVGIVCFCVFAYFKWIKGKKLFKNKYIDY